MLEALVVGVVASAFVGIWFERRVRYQKDIKVILKQCRESEAWDEKAESKLCQWMLGVPEYDVHNCGLRTLYQIRRSLRDYLHVQLWGRDPVPPPGRIELFVRSILIGMESRRQNKMHNRRSCKEKQRKRRKKDSSTYLSAERK